MPDDFSKIEIDEFADEYDSPELVEEAAKEVEEGIWTKLERVGQKISFAKDIVALYSYLFDGTVSWYRKSIVVGALIYFITPIDAIPDLAPLFGYMDDLGVITAVLKFLGSELIPYYNKDK